MTRRVRLPIRHRLMLMFAGGLSLVVAVLSGFVYLRTGADLMDTIDAGLRSRAELLVSDLQQHGPALLNPGAHLIESDEVFAQIDDPAGHVLQSSQSVARSPLLPAQVIGTLGTAGYYDRVIPGVDNVTRIFAVPVVSSYGRFVVLAGISLQDRDDELSQLAVSLAAGGSAAVVVISAGAWLALASALKPVERMRKQAAAISATTAGRRLSPPAGRDEISLLAATLNQMLDRIDDSVTRERQFVDRASHELRTPLSIQRIDLDLALSGPQNVAELAESLRSVSAENEHLSRLTDDLLVLSRAREGLLPIRRVDITLAELLAPARRHHAELAGDVQVSFHAEDERVSVDPVWFRQVVHNLVDNAVRHTPAGGQVTVRASRRDRAVELLVEDTGPGFGPGAAVEWPPSPGKPAGPITRSDGFDPFEPFAAFARPGGRHTTGLGLAVVRMIAEAHQGRVRAENRPEGGARLTMTIPDPRP